VSFAHLWSEQGKRAEARELLAPTYGWFTEGFNLPDLKELTGTIDFAAISNCPADTRGKDTRPSGQLSQSRNDCAGAPWRGTWFCSMR
jgi:hypothetical protein